MLSLKTHVNLVIYLQKVISKKIRKDLDSEPDPDQ